MPEMQILNALEQSEFDSPPEFDSANRKKHFDFPLGILELVEQLRTPTNKACFLLASGYFSATKKFYAPQQFRQLDIEYVCGKVGLNPQDVNFVQYDKQTLLRHEQMILIFYGFKPFNARAAPFVEREIENFGLEPPVGGSGFKSHSLVSAGLSLWPVIQWTAFCAWLAASTTNRGLALMAHISDLLCYARSLSQLEVV
jgi:hypothetical protein